MIAERRPLDIGPLSSRTLADLLQRSRAFGDERPFLISEDGETQLTFGAFLQRVAGTADRLSQRFAPGRRVACALPNCAEYLVLRYALSCAGLVEVAINWQHRGNVLRHMLEITGPTAIVATAAGLANVQKSGFDLASVEIIDESGLAELVSHGQAFEARSTFRPQPGDACRILFSSGTTGPSKAVELSQAYEVYVGQRHVNLLDIGPSDRWLYVTPLFHIDALYIVSTLLHTGGSLVLAGGFSRRRFWPIVKQTKSTFLCYVGSILAILLNGPPEKLHSSLRYVVGGGATPQQISAFEGRFAVRVIESYAMTECIACTLSRYEQRRLGSVGKPVPGYEVAIVNGDGHRMRNGEPGEIAVRCEEPFGLFTRYVGGPNTAAHSQPEGWFRTGDLGKLDEDGYLYFLGRGTDSIRVKGENVSCIEVEQAIAEFPGVAACAAVGIASALVDQEILLFVEPDVGRRLDLALLALHASERLAPFMIPHHVKVVQKLPRTATHKVAKAELPRNTEGATSLRRLSRQVRV